MTDKPAPTLTVEPSPEAIEAATPVIQKWQAKGGPPKSTIAQRWDVALVLDEHARALTEERDRLRAEVERLKARTYVGYDNREHKR